MAANTKKFNFKKPDESDFYSIQDQNGNWDKAEDALDDLDNPAFEDYTGGTTVPSADAALGAMKSRSKISALLANIKAFCKGCCTLAMIVNNCVTNNPKLPLSAAQGKALMDLFTQLNSDMIAKANFFGIKKVDAVVNSGYYAVIDARITATTIVNISPLYGYENPVFNYFFTPQAQSGRINVYVRRTDNTPPPDGVKISFHLLCLK